LIFPSQLFPTNFFDGSNVEIAMAACPPPRPVKQKTAGTVSRPGFAPDPQPSTFQPGTVALTGSLHGPFSPRVFTQRSQ
jgi:hypothetical protein